jgi:hypothetical protein
METSQSFSNSSKFLFWGSLCAYLITRLLFIKDYPIYFLFDEAMQSILASEFIESGFFGFAGQWLPVFFPSAGDWSISTTVYLHTPLVAIFGHSITASRSLSAGITVLAAVSVYWMLRDGFKSKAPWIGILFLSLTPTWFIHSRTSLVVAPMVSFYALFIVSYQRFIQGERKFLFLGAASAAGAYYSYSAGQILVPITAAALVLSNIRTHLRDWRWSVLGGFLFLLILAPALAFRAAHPELLHQQLSRLTGVITGDGPLYLKVLFVGENYLGTLNPLLWFGSNQEIPRHQMGEYNHILMWMFPFFCIGVAYALATIRNSASRTLLIALLLTPLSTALVGVSVLRAQAFVFPAVTLSALGGAVLVTALGLTKRRLFAPIAFAGLAALNLQLLRDTLVKGPTWSREYGLYGMQWGASQLFEQEIPNFITSRPETKFRVSPHWANGGDVFPRFFKAGPRIEVASIESALRKKDPTLSRYVYISPAAEFLEAVNSGLFKDPVIHRILNYPDGEPGFYFAEWEYSDSADRILELLALKRLVLEESEVTIEGELATVKHSASDMGPTQHAFDKDPKTLLRGASLNPFIIEIEFSSERLVDGLSLNCGDPRYTATLVITDQEGLTQKFSASSLIEGERGIAQLSFSPQRAHRIAIEIKNTAFATNDKDYTLPDAHIHVYSVDFNFVAATPQDSDPKKLV